MDAKLSLIIPIYNAEKFILDTLLRLTEWKSKINYTVQVILISDGSIDHTTNVVRDYIDNIDNSIKLCEYKLNKGKGYAVRMGMMEASGEYRIYTDADIPFGFEVIDKFLHYLDFKEFDCVVGDRKLTDSSYFTEISKARKIGSLIFSFIVGRFVSGGYFDTQCGIKGYRAKVSEDLFSLSRINGFAFDVEILYIALKRNYEIKRLPVVLVKNEGSTVSMLHHGFGMFLDLFKIKLNHITNKYNRKNEQKINP